MTLKLIRQIVN